MSISSSEALGPPTFDDFEVIRYTFGDIARQPDSIVRPLFRSIGMYVHLKQIYANMDHPGSLPLVVSLGGVLIARAGGYKLDLSYRETTYHEATGDSSLIHNYSFLSEEDHLIGFAQSIFAKPQISQPPEELVSITSVVQQQRGEKILAASTGQGLEPTAGDCGVLCDRMYGLLHY